MYTAARNDDAKDEATSKARTTAEDIRRGAGRLKDDVENDISKAAKAVRADLKDFAQHAGSYVHDMANSTEENFVEQVREKPIAATLIAAGVGFVLGALLARR